MPSNDKQFASFHLRIADVDDGLCRVEAFSAQEALNELYDVRATVTVNRDVDLELVALKQPAAFTISHGERSRTFHGIVREVTFAGGCNIGGVHGYRYDTRLAPRAWLMTQRRTSRIFQRLRIDQIIDRVLAPYFVSSRWLLEQPCPEREYCTQYEESDWELVCRLCAEAGVFFYFEQPGASPGDTPAAVMSAAVGAADAALRGAAGPVGDVLSRLTGVLGGPREVLAFIDGAGAYPPIRQGAAVPWETMAEELAGALGRSAAAEGAAALSGAAGATLAAGSALGAASRSALGALGGARNAPALHMRGESGALAQPDAETVLSFFSGRRVRPHSFAYQEFDPQRPNAQLSAAYRHDDHQLPSLDRGREALSQLMAGNAPSLGSVPLPTGLPAGAGDALRALTDGEQLFEHYDHHSSFLHPNWEYERGEPERMGRSARRDAEIAGGESNCPWLEAGHLFALEGHELDRYNRPYVAVEVRHEGRAAMDDEPQSYRNRFRCVPASTPYPPQKPPRRSVQTCLTAVVMAADDTQIHTDHAARVRVRFHWDRGQPGEAFNTCWLRVMQPWAGAGWGALFLPRAGCEVVVAFEGGDPDRPLVLGGLYNGANPPPVGLPQHKTKSGFRTASTPSAEGANELWFEDRSGQEQLYMHAQRDLDIEVENDRSLAVQRDDVTNVHRDQRLRVDGDASHDVRGSREVVIGTDDRLRVEGNRSVTTQGDDRRVVEGDVDLRIDGRQQTAVRGAVDQLVEGDTVARHQGNLTTIVGRSDARRGWSTHVEGPIRHSSSGEIELSADEALVLRVGQTSLRLTADTAVLSSPSISLLAGGARLRLGGDCARLQADDALQGVANTVAMKSSGAALGLSSEASLDGSRVLLNSPGSAEDSIEDEVVEPTIIELTDDDGQPLAGHPYRIVLADGAELSGVLDEDGRAEIEIDGDAEIFFPGLIDVEAQ